MVRPVGGRSIAAEPSLRRRLHRLQGRSPRCRSDPAAGFVADRSDDECGRVRCWRCRGIRAAGGTAIRSFAAVRTGTAIRSGAELPASAERLAPLARSSALTSTSDTIPTGAVSSDGASSDRGFADNGRSPDSNDRERFDPRLSQRLAARRRPLKSPEGRRRAQLTSSSDSSAVAVLICPASSICRMMSTICCWTASTSERLTAPRNSISSESI